MRLSPMIRRGRPVFEAECVGDRLSGAPRLSRDSLTWRSCAVPGIRKLRSGLSVGLAVVIISTPTAAQLGRWTATVTVGWATGESLWSIARQPLRPYFLLNPDDTVALSRA